MKSTVPSAAVVSLTGFGLRPGPLSANDQVTFGLTSPFVRLLTSALPLRVFVNVQTMSAPLRHGNLVAGRAHGVTARTILDASADT